VLASLGDAPRQLATHVAAAMKAGYGASELRAVCEPISLYAGIPHALNGIEVVAEVLLESGQSLPPAQRRIQL
jgi:alkylhydroperoxidase/carboxymuconolactone decarboxylase family protein YurZ